MQHDDFEGDGRPRVPEVELLLNDVRQSTSSGGPARAYLAIEALRAAADRYERDLIRMLRWSEKGDVIRSWSEIAELVDAALGSRQAAHQRWGRLKAPGRGQARRGRPPGAVGVNE